MRSLFHRPFDPASRFARLCLAEKGLVARLVEPEDDAALAQVNPALTVPVLIDEPPTGGEIAVSPASAIGEYLNEAYRDPPLLPLTSAARAEARRLFCWFDEKFDDEVTALIVRRRIARAGRGSAEPEPARAAMDALCWHLDYLSFLFENRPFLAGEEMTVADLAGAAHLSVHDYFGFIPWADFPEARGWYARMKSRPAMRPLLAERLSGAAPAAHYADPDF